MSRRTSQKTAGFTERLARSSATHPWRTVGIWVTIIVVAVISMSLLPSNGLTSETKQHGKQPDSAIAQQLIEERVTGEKKMTDFVIVRCVSLTVDDPAYKGYVTGLAAKIQALGPRVVEATSTFYQTKDPTMVSRDKRSTLIAVVLAGDTDSDIEQRGDVVRPLGHVAHVPDDADGLRRVCNGRGRRGGRGGLRTRRRGRL